VIVIRKDNYGRIAHIQQSIATSRKPNVVIGLNESIDHCGFVWTAF
jgi:hypothetical protein